MNSKEYKIYLPSDTELSKDQQRAVRKEKPVFITGLAGTGKSVVSLFRHVRNIENNKNSVIVCFNNVLHRYLWLAVKAKNTNASARVHSLWGFVRKTDQRGYYIEGWGGVECKGYRTYCQNGQKLDEIIIDEAQDVEYKAFEALRFMCLNISCGADFNQNLYKGIEEDSMMKFLSQNIDGYEIVNLDRNYRNTYYILSFIAAFIPEIRQSERALRELKSTKPGIKPYVFSNEKNGSLNDVDIIKDIISTINDSQDYGSNLDAGGNIAILLPYTNCENDRSGDKKSNVDYYYNELIEFGASKYHSNMTREQKNNLKLTRLFITTFKSSKGLEFDTVIIPKINQMSDVLAQNFYSVHDYYVALSRAKANLYLISDEPVSKLAHFNDISPDIYELEKFNEYVAYDIDKDEIPW